MNKAQRTVIVLAILCIIGMLVYVPHRGVTTGFTYYAWVTDAVQNGRPVDMTRICQQVAVVLVVTVLTLAATHKARA